jgi:hypothetical protein
MLDERCVHLTSAEDYSRDLIARFDFFCFVCGIINNPFKVRFTSELVNGRACNRMAKKILGEEENKCCSYASAEAQLGMSQRHSRFRNCRFICRLRMWNVLDGFVRYAICMLQSWCCRSSLSGDGKMRGSSLHSCKNRSILPDECSGPWPSYPCGILITSPDRCSHLTSPEAMN